MENEKKRKILSWFGSFGKGTEVTKKKKGLTCVCVGVNFTNLITLFKGFIYCVRGVYSEIV